MTGALSLSATGIRKAYKRSDFALSVDRIEAPAGSTLALLGPSGSGKTTLLHVLGLLEKPDSGQVLLGGRPVAPGDREARLSMAGVFQRPYLFKGTVAGNVGYGLAMRGVPTSDRPARIAQALEHVGLEGYGPRGAHQLSGGEAQRVSLARALVLNPRVLLLDEPLGSLDALLKRKLAQEFARIVRGTDSTVIWVTHDQDEAMMVADQVAIVNAGRVVTSGHADTIMGLPSDDWTAAFLGVEPPQHGRVTSSSAGLVDISAGGVTLEVTGDADTGTEVLFAIRPEDVLLFEPGVDLPLATARNRLPATVVSCTSRGATNHIVLQVGGLRLAASVSRAATQELNLAPGAQTLAVFKASAVRWRPADVGAMGTLN
ncbi:MAG: ABC transporter ATP-binding protein [Coriobacteriia bacterium]|nr:ABC transporter ATP-binding protein [Coriobacteriia bacterium]